MIDCCVVWVKITRKSWSVWTHRATCPDAEANKSLEESNTCVEIVYEKAIPLVGKSSDQLHDNIISETIWRDGHICLSRSSCPTSLVCLSCIVWNCTVPCSPPSARQHKYSVRVDTKPCIEPWRTYREVPLCEACSRGRPGYWDCTTSKSTWSAWSVALS